MATAAAVLVSCVSISVVTMNGAQAQTATLAPADLRNLALKKNTNSLKTVATTDSPTFFNYVMNRTVLAQLGKALFWDQATGSDGQACASCHFHGGADNRSKNQVNPGFRNTTIPGGDTAFGNSPLGAMSPNYQLTVNDFPFHMLQDPNDQNSLILSDTNDIVSSQGAFNATFSALRLPTDPVFPMDISTPITTGVFKDSATGALIRNVEPRNTPTVVDAVLNDRNFWDGRGRREFNGINPLGTLDPQQFIQFNYTYQRPVLVTKFIRQSSAASQATGPGTSDLEMSFHMRRFPEIGRKLLNAIPLSKQTLTVDDSVLGVITTGGVINQTYAQLIQAAFWPQWLDAPGWLVDISTGTPKIVKASATVTAGPQRFTVLEFNFSLYFGLAVEEYEKFLIANDSPFDQFMDGNDTALSYQQQSGLQVFMGQGRCVNCHGGAELTNATLSSVQRFQVLERMVMGNDRVAVYDNGFYNTGVRQTLEDLGVGAVVGPNNKPLSNSRNYQDCVKNKLAANAALSLAQANTSCQVPRILARPTDAAQLLTKAAALVGNPQPVLDLLNKSSLQFAKATPATILGSCLLAKNPLLKCPTTTVANPDGTTTTTQNNGAFDLLAALPTPPDGFADLLAAAVSLLPDQVSPGSSSKLLAPLLQPQERVAVNGAFKTSTIRNVELTGPYFHNGGTLTLEQLVDFYNRGGDFAAANQDNLDVDIRPLGLSDGQKADLVAFMKSTTDNRLRLEMAPFDHPSLNIPNGGSAATYYTLFDFGLGTADMMDDRVTIPAVGPAGCISLAAPCTNGITTGLGVPNTPYANFLQSLTP